MAQTEIDTNFKEIWALFKETDARFKETDHELSLRFKETDKQFKETARQFKETDKKLRKLETLFTGQWGKLIESLAESGIVELLQSRGIEVNSLSRRIYGKKQGRQTEIDFLITNSTELVMGEVKTTLKADDVRHFMKKLKDFSWFFPVYKNFKTYGGMIAVHIDEGVSEFACHQGLFVFKVGGKGTLSLLNDAAFQPKDFRTAPGIEDD
jgi:hypothetical protein